MNFDIPERLNQIVFMVCFVFVLRREVINTISLMIGKTWRITHKNPDNPRECRESEDFYLKF